MSVRFLFQLGYEDTKKRTASVTTAEKTIFFGLPILLDKPDLLGREQIFFLLTDVQIEMASLFNWIYS